MPDILTPAELQEEQSEAVTTVTTLIFRDEREEKLRPGVLVIYTGGTIGSKPRDPDPDSPQVVVPWPELKAGMREIERLPYVVDCISVEPPLDSCNVGPDQWKVMAETIGAYYQEYAGFVILHGTDTMVYTGSALSFMLKDLQKPVILTGAQRSALVSIRNDATQNLLTALEIANPQFSNLPVVPEVCIFFGGKLLRANRTMKLDTVGYDAYDTPNLEPLGVAGDRLLINQRVVRPPGGDRTFQVRTNIDRNVLPVFITPGIQDTSIVEQQLSTPGLRAAVVLSFGSGNIPTKHSFLDEFGKAHEQGIILANVSQCPRGPVELGIYETSAELLELGFIAGSDILLEAALCKLMVLLGDPDVENKDVELEFQRNEAGEHSFSVYPTLYPQSGGTLGGDTNRFRVRGVPIEGMWDTRRLDRALIRLRGARVTGPELTSASDRPSDTVNGGEVEVQPGVAAQGEAVEYRVFLNLDPGATPDESSPGFAGRYRRWPSGRQGVTMFDITRAFRSTSKPGDRVSFTILCDTPGASLTWESADLAVFVRELDET